MRPSLFHRLNRTVRRTAAGIGEGLGRLGAAIVSPIERAFAATFGRAFHLLEGFERVEDWLIGLVRLLTWPLRMAWRLVAAAGSIIVPASVREGVAERVHSSGRRLERVGAAAWRLAERLNLDGVIRWLAWLLQPVWRPLAAVFGFLYAWLATRPYKQMVWGLPALVLLVPIGAAVVWGKAWGRESVAAQYRAAAKEAREAEDYSRMQLFESKLAKLGVDTRGADFQSALVLEQKGKLEEAFKRMQRLAPEASIGYPAAHHWLAVKLISGEIALPLEDRLRMAGAHLDHLAKLGAKGADMDLLRAIWLAQSKRLEEAADLLAPHISRLQLAALHRMEIDLRLNRLDEARRDARALRVHLQEAQREAQRRGEKLDSGRRQAWAQAERLIGDGPAFTRVVRQWLKDDPTNPTARRDVATVDGEEFNEILNSTHPDAGELAERLVEISTLVDNPAALEPQVAALFSIRNQAPAVGAMLDQLIAADDTPLPLIAAIGTAAAMKGEVELARTLLARVVASDADHAVAWNNYACALAQEPEMDLQKALAAVNRALELTPKEFRFRETRGQILTSLGRWQEAVDDLEFALNGMPDVPAIHISLAKAYEALGETELAEIHRQQVP